MAVGTTTTRTLETAVRAGAGRLPVGGGVSDLYLYPGVTFQVTGALFTNFHLPRSSLLLLVSAFAGKYYLNACFVGCFLRLCGGTVLRRRPFASVCIQMEWKRGWRSRCPI